MAAGTALITYVTAQTLRRILRNAADYERAVALLRKANVSRVVIESYRSGCVVEEGILQEARKRFESHGFVTLGGLMPVHGEGFGKRGEGIETRCPFFCYTSEETVRALEAEIRKLARQFRQVIIDDAFLTSCRCDACDKARAGRPWSVFRRDLLCTVAEQWVRGAHEENADIRLTVKFPQYYDRYHEFGYDAARFPAIFDAVWQGTETRDPNTLAYGYTEPYQGYFNMLWMRACAGNKLESAWFDWLDCDDQQYYEQAVTTHLAAPVAITLFCYSEELFAGEKMARMTHALPDLARLHDEATEPRGVHVIKPPNSDGGRDLFVFDYLGMMGVPCVPATQLSPSMRSVIVPGHGLADPPVASAIPKAIHSGQTVIVTFDALWRMSSDPTLLQLFGYRPSEVAPAATVAEAFDIGQQRIRPAQPIRLAGDLAPTGASVLAWAVSDACEHGELRIPFITAKTHATGGQGIVWNIGAFGQDAFDIRERLNVPVKSDLLLLPQEVLDILRSTATAPLGVTISAPPRIAVFWFEKRLVCVNYADIPAKIVITGLRMNEASLFSDALAATCSGNALSLPPRSYASVAATKKG